MVISFEVDNRFKGVEPTVLNVRRNTTKTFLHFPQDGVDITWDNETELYKVFFDTEVELDDKNTITPLIKEVKRIYLRKQKIKKILNGRKN